MADKLTNEEFERLRRAVMQAESRGNRYAINPVSGAVGSMQTMPATLRDPGFGVKPARDNSPAEQERVGIDYLRAMTDRYKTIPEALAAYNHGPGNIDAHKGNLNVGALPAETQKYIPNVMKMAGLVPNYQGDVRKFDNPPPVVAQAPVVPPPPQALSALPDAPLASVRPVDDTVTPPALPVAQTAVPAPLPLPLAAQVKPDFQMPKAELTGIDRLRASQMPDLVALFEALRKRQLSV